MGVNALRLGVLLLLRGQGLSVAEAVSRSREPLQGPPGPPPPASPCSVPLSPRNSDYEDLG